MDLDPIIQAILFGLFAEVTALLSAVIGPTYDNLLVPELGRGALYPSFTQLASGPTFLSTATSFSGYVVTGIVDPAVVLVAVLVGVLYLGRSVFGSLAARAEGMVPRLVLAVALANFTLPIAQALLDLASATYSVVGNFDGGAWQHWVNLAGVAEIGFTWDNGAVAFVVSVALFTVIFGLTIAVAIRNALLGVILVLLPILTLLWPIPTLAPLTKRVWWLLGELAFLPCVMVIPLELAVGAGSIILLLGYLTVALSAPVLIGMTASRLPALGFPGAGAVMTGGVRQGLQGASQVGGRLATPAAQAVSRGSLGWLGGAVRSASAAPVPITFPLLAAEAVGHGAMHLARQLPSLASQVKGGDRFPPIQRGPGPPK